MLCAAEVLRGDNGSLNVRELDLPFVPQIRTTFLQPETLLSAIPEKCSVHKSLYGNNLLEGPRKKLSVN